MDSTKRDADHAIKIEAGTTESGDPETGFEITVVERTDGESLSKNYSLVSGKLHGDINACKIINGRAWRMRLMGCTALAAFIEDIGPKAFLLGSIRADIPDSVDVVTNTRLHKLGHPRGVISRTKDHIVFEPGKPAAMMFDFDFGGMPPSVRQQLEKMGGPVNALESVFPEFAEVGRIIRKSTSAGISNSYTGQKFTESGGLHLNVVVADGSDIGRATKVVFQRLWLAGLGWIVVGKRCRLLPKSIIDASVGSPERIVFEAHATMNAPLVQDRAARAAEAREGPMLDTHKCILDLTAPELKNYDDLVAAERNRVAPQVREVNEERAGVLVNTLGIDIKKARHIVKQQNTHHILRPHETLEFDDLGPRTVGQVLANPDDYINETLADPDEGIEYGSGKAKVLRGNRDGWPFIKSFAHGGAEYQLRWDAAAIEEAMKADPTDAAHVLAVMVNHADVDPVELDRLIQQAMKLADIKTKTAIKELIKQEKGGREDQPDDSRQENPEGDPDGDPLWASVYSVFNGCIHFESPSGRMMPICNFDARIEETLTIDYGDNIRTKIFRISGTTNKGVVLPRVDIPADKLTTMWWIASWDGKATVEPNYVNRIHHALQKLSSPTERTVYSHLGWRKIDGKWLYLHGDGAVGSDGAVEGIECKPEGRLGECVLIPPRDIKAAVQASLEMLTLGPTGSVAYATTYRAPLGEFLPIDFSVWVSGITGAMKSSILGIMQGHWGKTWTYNRLVTNWTTSAVTIEKLAYQAKDTLFTVDDFSPQKTAWAQKEFNQKAEYLLRGAGNQQGRGRMKPDTSLHNVFSPRGMIVGSGEDIPAGESLQARTVNVPMNRGDVQRDAILELDRSVKDGLMAEAMFGYAKWIAGRADTDEKALRSAITKQHADLIDTSVGEHGRTVSNLSSLRLGAVLGMEFAVAVGAISGRLQSETR